MCSRNSKRRPRAVCFCLRAANAVINRTHWASSLLPQVAYLYAKTVTLGRTHWPATNRVMLRNRRIGCSMSGISQFIAKRGAWLERLRVRAGVVGLSRDKVCDCAETDAGVRSIYPLISPFPAPCFLSRRPP